MKNKITICIICLVVATVFAVSAVFGWFYYFNSQMDMTTLDGIKVSLYRRDVSDNSNGDVDWQPYDGKELQVSYVNFTPQEDYKIEVTNTDGVSSKTVALSFGNMVSYLFSETLLSSYFSNPTTFKNYKFSTATDGGTDSGTTDSTTGSGTTSDGTSSDEETSGESTTITSSLELEKILNYDAAGNYAQTARLLYTVHDLAATCGGESVAKISSGFENDFNLYLASEGEVVMTATVPARETVEITFSLFYTANMQDYENYGAAVAANTNYKAEVVKQAKALSINNEYSNAVSDTDATEYLKVVTQKETELLLSTTAMSFLFTPKIVVVQNAREELS
jgi:hypothetical protein